MAGMGEVAVDQLTFWAPTSLLTVSTFCSFL